MPKAARLNDKGTQHDGYYETVITAGSPTVFIDGLPAARLGDPLTPHDKPKHPPEPGMQWTAAAWLLVAVR